MLQLKMYCRFVFWILKKVFGVFKFVPVFLDGWRHAVRYEFATSMSIYTIMVIGSVTTSVVMGILRDGTPVKEQYVWSGFISSTVLYSMVIISALYQVFLEDYEKSFTILKDNQTGE
jgi:hypothetical protein